MDIIIPLIIALINCIIIFVYVLLESFKLTKFKSDLNNIYIMQHAHIYKIISISNRNNEKIMEKIKNIEDRILLL